MASKMGGNINTPVEKVMFSGGKPSGTTLPMHKYPGETGINKTAGTGTSQTMNSPAPNKLLGSMSDDDRSNGK